MDLAEQKRMTRGSKSKEARNLMVGLDIGTSKVIAIVATGRRMAIGVLVRTIPARVSAGTSTES